MTGFYFHLTNTIMKLLGLTIAIFISLLTKLLFMGRILLLQVQLMFGITQKLLKISLRRHLSPNKIKKTMSDAFFAKYWNNCQISYIFKLMLDDFSNFASSISVSTFYLCCCYFFIYCLVFLWYIELNYYYHQLN